MNLTQREREVLQWVYHGKTTGEIATILGIGRTTVSTYLQSSRDKLDCCTPAQTMCRAVELGIVGGRV